MLSQIKNAMGSKNLDSTSTKWHAHGERAYNKFYSL